MKERTTYRPTGQTWATRSPKLGDIVAHPHCQIRPLKVIGIRTLAYLLASAKSQESRARYRRNSPQGLAILSTLDGRNSYPVPLGVDAAEVVYLVQTTTPTHHGQGERGRG